MHDLKYAARSLAKTPGFTIVVVLTLAFGVAVNANIFGLFGSLFLRSRISRTIGRAARASPG